MTLHDLIPWSRSRESVPVRREDRNPFVALQEEMNRLFDDFGSWEGERAPFEAMGAYRPRIDVSETEDAVEVRAELPGLTEKEIELSLANGVLTLSGEKKEERDGARYTERRYGSFRRSIPLPAEVDEEKIDATCKNGVLEVHLPKTAQAKSDVKRIAVKSA